MAVSRLCSIPDCGKPHEARGWCHAHYRRWRRHGDPLGGSTSLGAPQQYLRETVLTYEGENCLLWPYARTRGYAVMRPDNNSQFVSRLVCEHVHGPPPTPSHEAAHSCGRGRAGCVTKRHLFWKTPKENSADKLIHGTHNRGERHGNCKLTEAAVRAIRAAKGKEFQTVTAARYDISPAAVRLIQRGKRWAWLDYQ